MQASKIPRLNEIFSQVWYSMGLLLVLMFLFKITLFTAEDYGALPAALVFFALTMMVLYTVIFATSRNRGPL